MDSFGGVSGGGRTLYGDNPRGSGPDRRRGRDSYAPRPYDRPSHRPRDRPRRLEDTYGEDELMTTTQYERFAEVEGGAEPYSEYVRKHRRVALLRYFFAHKAEAWLKEQYDPFRVESISQAVRNVTAGRAREFREAIDSGIFEELCLEDSEDLRVEGEKNGETTRSFPASMKLPSRLQGCIAKRGNVITLSNISPHVSRDELETMLRECSSSFVSLELALPVSEKSNYRLGWATFTDGTELGPIVATIEEKIMHGDKVYSSAQKSFSLQIKIADPSFSHPDRIVKDWSLAKNMMEALDKRNGIETSLNLEGNSEKSQLDLIITYLRQVHFVCYYSGVTAQGPNELATIAGDIFVRSAQGDAPLSGEALETHDLLIADLTERISHAYQQETEDSLLERHVQKIDEGRFKCGHCEKLFKAPDFVLKHIRLRHEDVSKAATLETAMANAFLAHPPLCAVLPMPRRRSHSPPPQEAPNRRERDYGRTRRPPPKDAPHDPRRIRQYVDWDAPAAGDMEISYD